MILKSVRWTWLAIPLAVLAGGFLLDWLVSLWIDGTWFDELGYGQVWSLKVVAPCLIGLVAWGIALPVIGSQFRLAWPEPNSWRRGLVVLLSGGMAWAIAQQWFPILTWFYRVPFQSVEPVFGRDASFYVFSLPVLALVQTWGLSLAALVFALVLVLYWRRTRNLSSMEAMPVLQAAQRHLMGLAGVVLLFQGWGHWLSRYVQLYSNRGSFTGANFTDIKVQIPADVFLMAVCVMTAIALFALAVRKPNLIVIQSAKKGDLKKGDSLRWNWRSLSLVLVLLGSYGLSFLLLGKLLPEAVQHLVVLPNELERDGSYIERNIKFTRQGFDLTTVEVQPFTIEDTLNASTLKDDAATLKNIRLWDSEPLLEAYRQLQEIRPYYQFPSVDIDRYMIDGQLRQVMHAARELDHSLLPERAQTWVNQHFFYTHGYGLTLSPVNVVTRVGLPDFFIKDIPPRATEKAVEEAIPIKNPAIYYGELSDSDVFVNTKSLELDYPSADETNIYGTYKGEGGMPVGTFLHRLLFAWHFRDGRILLSDQFTPESKVLFRRQITTRIKTIAPFLRYDNDPYMVIADGNLYWMVDAYTTSDRYPYSEPASPPNDFNYIRNSVKVVIDAYHGSVDFYLARPDDAMAQTYARLYPTLFKPIAQMPKSLQDHLRYPVDLFEVQSQQYATYHMTEPQMFYNKEDLWQIPQEIRPKGKSENFRLGTNDFGLALQATEQKGPQPMHPYYLILELDNLSHKSGNEGSNLPEFVLLSPFTPANKQNLIAWMAGRSDGKEYGKLLVYEFSRQSLVFGPQQVEARINQNPAIAQQLSLWNVQGSRVNRGSLLIIPVKQSLLYVQPLFLEAEDSRLPELTRVIVAYEDRVVMQPTLEEAFQELFAAESTKPEAGSPEATELEKELQKDRERQKLQVEAPEAAGE